MQLVSLALALAALALAAVLGWPEAVRFWDYYL